MTATLATSRGQGKSKQAQQRFIRQIRTNVRDITPLDYFSIDNKITQTADNQQASYKPTPKGEAPSTEIINSLIAGGFATKAAHMLASDSSIAAPNEEVITRLIELHPPRNLQYGHFPQLPQDSPPPQLQVTAKHLLKCARKLNTGKAPGPTGITMQHIIFLLLNETTAPHLATVISLLIRGLITGEAKNMLLASRLIAIKRGSKIRPVAVGETLYRLAAHYAIGQIGNLSDLFPRIQLGLHKAGTEKYIHRLQAFLEKQQEDCTIMSLDIKNAFNTRSRVKMATTLFNEQKTHPIWRIFHWAYDEPSQLNIFHQNGAYLGTILSQEGVRQGDILASFIFSLSMQPAYEKISDILAKASNEPLPTPSQIDISQTPTPTGPHTYSTHTCAYIDDLTIAANTQNLISKFPQIAQVLEQEGLTVNWSKTSLFWAGNEHNIPHELPLFAKNPFGHNSPYSALELKTGYLEVLGSFIGPNLHKISQHLQDNSDSLTLILQRLNDPQLQIPTQSAYLILRKCALPKINYLCRTLGPAAATVTDTFSRQILATMAKLGGCNKATAPLWTLKLKHGGLGLLLPSTLLAPAYLSSLCLAAKDINSLTPSSPPQSPNNNFPRLYAAFTETHSLLKPFFAHLHNIKPQSHLLNYFKKTADDTWNLHTSKDAPHKKIQSHLTEPLYNMLRETLTRDLHPTARQHLSALEASKLGHRHLIINPSNSTNTLTDTQWKYTLHLPPSAI